MKRYNQIVVSGECVRNDGIGHVLLHPYRSGKIPDGTPQDRITKLTNYSVTRYRNIAIAAGVTPKKIVIEYRELNGK